MADLLGIASYTGHLLLCGYVILASPLLRRYSARLRGAMVVAGLLSVCMPWTGECGLFYLRGLIGDLSVTTQALLVLAMLRHGGCERPCTRALRRRLAFGMVLILLALYAGTLGFLPWDLYTLGYEPRAMVVGMALVLVVAWHLQPGFALALLAGLAAFQFHLLGSPNLWDYLADPLLCVGALLRTAVRGRSRCGATSAQSNDIEIVSFRIACACHAKVAS